MAIVDVETSSARTVAAVRHGLVANDSLLALVGLLLVSCVYLVVVYNHLANTLTDRERAEAFVGKDSSHYLEMAEAFRSGQFLDKYVTVRPHRQPLYPALVAAAMALGAQDLMELATVNVLIGLFTIIFLYVAGRWLFGSWWVGLAGGLGYASSDFMMDNISSRILTEPSFVLTALLAAVFGLKYMEFNRLSYLCVAAAGAGLAYLARPNGLFFMASMWATLLLHDLLQPSPPVSSAAAAAITEPSWRTFKSKYLIGRFSLAALIFVIVATPSWFPRVIEYGDPVYHGYLSNYLWVDTYEEGHISEPKYGPHDYFSTHDFSDILHRVGAGLEHVWWIAPNKLAPISYKMALLGMICGVITFRHSYLFFALFLCMTTLPMVWTSMPNPNLRVHYTVLFPFLLIWLMILAHLCGSAIRNARLILAERCSSGKSVV